MTAVIGRVIVFVAFVVGLCAIIPPPPRGASLVFGLILFVAWSLARHGVSR